MNPIPTFMASLLLACGFIFAQTSQPATTQSAELEQLIPQLSDNNFQTRESAEKKIIEIGEAAATRMDQLAKETSDPEVRLRAQNILKALERANYNKPTLVTLQFNNAAPAAAFEALYQQ